MLEKSSLHIFIVSMNVEWTVRPLSKSVAVANSEYTVYVLKGAFTKNTFPFSY